MTTIGLAQGGPMRSRCSPSASSAFCRSMRCKGSKPRCRSIRRASAASLPASPSTPRSAFSHAGIHRQEDRGARDEARHARRADLSALRARLEHDRDAATTSASGLDPHISPQFALAQVPWSPPRAACRRRSCARSSRSASSSVSPASSASRSGARRAALIRRRGLCRGRISYSERGAAYDR
jgi:hypothetical protein